MENMFNTDDKIKRAFLFYAPRERIQNVNPIRRTSKDEVCTWARKRDSPLTLSKGLFSYAGRTLNAKYGCDPHSMFTLNLDDKRETVKIECMAKCLWKDTFMLSDLTSNPKVPEKVIFSESK